MYFLDSVYKQERLPVDSYVVYFSDTNPSGQLQSSISPYCGKVRNSLPPNPEGVEPSVLVATFINYKDSGNFTLSNIPARNLLTPEDIALTFPNHFDKPTTDGNSSYFGPSPVIKRLSNEPEFRRELTQDYIDLLGKYAAIGATRSL